VYTLDNVLLMIGLGLIPTVFGHTILNYSMKFFRGQVVSVTNLAQPIFAGILGYLFFGEAPRPVFFAAAALILLGVLIVLFAARMHSQPVPDDRPEDQIPLPSSLDPRVTTPVSPTQPDP
jgi:drug/metabolite transporter (DMT)-like permease